MTLVTLSDLRYWLALALLAFVACWLVAVIITGAQRSRWVSPSPPLWVRLLHRLPDRLVLAVFMLACGAVAVGLLAELLAWIFGLPH